MAKVRAVVDYALRPMRIVGADWGPDPKRWHGKSVALLAVDFDPIRGGLVLGDPVGFRPGGPREFFRIGDFGDDQ